VSRTDELRAEATAARENLVATVGELGDTVSEVKQETVRTARHYAPYAAAVAGAGVLLKIVGIARRRR
jgi:hypothetical protein